MVNLGIDQRIGVIVPGVALRMIFVEFFYSWNMLEGAGITIVYANVICWHGVNMHVMMKGALFTVCQY